MRAAALIVAAGRGTRAGADVPKQYVPLDGVPVLRRTLERFLFVPELDAVLTIIHPDDQARYEAAISGLDDARLLPPVSGGATRGASVRAGLGQLEKFNPEQVLIHDAARPFVSVQVIRDVLAALSDADGAFAALPVVDALWRGEGGLADAPVPRDGLWRAQTPQAFDFEKIAAAYQLTDGQAADDVAVARAAGLSVRIVPGDEVNFKITTPEDLWRAENLVAEKD